MIAKHTARAVERVRNGETVTDASRAEGCDLANLSRVCKRLGVATRGRGRPPTRDRATVARAVDRVCRGESVSVVAADEGMPTRSLYRYVTEASS